MDHYNDGYKAGRSDASIRLCSVIALTSDLEGYADGYKAGQAAYIAEQNPNKTAFSYTRKA